MSSRELEDEIFRLRKLNLQPQVAQVVEEAAEVLAQGREMEAEALVEKVAALLRRDLEIAT